jgi:hypothetical protein
LKIICDGCSTSERGIHLDISKRIEKSTIYWLAVLTILKNEKYESQWEG